MSKITFYIARHGKTLMNTLDKVQGWCDSPLTQEGMNMAEYLGYGMQDINFRTAYCSDLKRTRQTADILLEAKGQNDIPVVELFGFREACFGSFEADTNHHMWNSAALYLHYTSMEEMDKDIFAQKITFANVLDAIKSINKLEMAESYTQLERRTQDALRAVAEKEAENGDANILVVAHGMSIIGMLMSLGGDRLLKGMLENASVCKVIYQNGQFTVEAMGDKSYLEKGRSKSAK